MKNIKYIIIAIIFTLTALAVFLLMPKDNKKNIKIEKIPIIASTTIVAFGDSLTAGFGLPLSESYPAQLEAKLKLAGQGVRVINAGVSGETSRGNLERAQFIRSQNPSVVLLGIGGNDALRALPVSEFENNLSKTIVILQSGQRPPKLFLLRMQAPENAGRDYKFSFDGVYLKLSQKYKLEMIDFVVPEVFFDKTLMSKDGIHPNKEGYRVLVDKYIYPAVKSSVR